MQQKLQQFIFLSERILVEPGELLLRPTWKELQAISKDLSPYMKKLTFSFEPKYAFLFLLSCGSDSPQRNGCLSMLLRKTLESVPSREVMNVLSSVPRVDLNTYLLPFLYEKGVIGSVAAFTAAKLGLKVKFDAFEFFLDSREWNQIDLFNLSFLVLNDEKSVLINQLRAARKQSFTDFANVLESQTTQGTNPVMPELKASKQEIPNVEQTQNQTQKTSSKIEENTSNVDDSAQPEIESNNFADKAKNYFNGLQDKIKNSDFELNIDTDNLGESLKNSREELSTSSKRNDNSSKQIKKTNIYRQKPVSYSKPTIPVESNDSNKKNLVIGVSASILVIGIIALFNYANFGDLDKAEIKEPPMEVKVPEYYVDAVTQKKITPQYLEADVDYRMGELYLSRNMYDKAVKLYQDCLAREKNHYLAKLRWGYCELLQGNFFVAKKLLKEVLAAEPKLQNVNLYLARNSAYEKDFKSAKKYYQTEFNLYQSLDVGMEYANFLQLIGESNEAMEEIAKLQVLFPDKMLVLSAPKGAGIGE